LSVSRPLTALALSAVLGAAGLSAHGTVKAAPKAPLGSNVLIVVLDDVGTDKLASYGAGPEAPPTPHIDALAERGVTFRNAYAAPSCSPSRAAMLTGRYPRRFGFGTPLRARREVYELPLSEVTLPQVLGQSPLYYRNSAVGKWHLSTYNSSNSLRHPHAAGFEWFAGSLANLSATSTPSERGNYFHWEKNANGRIAFTESYATSDTVDDALARIQVMGSNSPWLLYVAFNAAHLPLHAPPTHLTAGAPVASSVDRFDASLVALDTELGRMLDSIDPAVLENTTVIVVSDNGTPADVSRHPGTGGKGSLAESGIRVPLIVAGPHVERPGTQSDALVHVVDVFATAVEIGGVEPGDIRNPAGERVSIDGVSLLPYLRDPTAPSQREFVYQDMFAPNGPGPYLEDERMVRDARYKLVEDTDGRRMFFDLAGRSDDGPDLLATEDLGDEERAAFARLRAQLTRTRAILDADKGAPAAQPQARHTSP